MTIKPEKIRMGEQGLEIPDYPLIPFIEGDGTGRIFGAAVRVWMGCRRDLR